MYKPVPFFLSRRGYGIAYQTSAPLTADVGKSCNLGNVAFHYEDRLDISFFTGTPKEILRAYTAETGRCQCPPLWSFGLWMSRITYKRQQEVLETAVRLRKSHIT